MSSDWNTDNTDWAEEEQKPTERTFKHDFQGFVFHLLMVGLIGTTVAAAFNLGLVPQPTVRIQVEDVR